MERRCAHYYSSYGVFNASGLRQVFVCCLVSLLINASFPVYEQVDHFSHYELSAACRICSTSHQVNGHPPHRSSQDKDFDRAPVSAHWVTASSSSRFFPTHLLAGALPTRASGWQQFVGVTFDRQPGESRERMQSNDPLRRHEAQPVVNSLRIKCAGPKSSSRPEVELVEPKSSNASQFLGSKGTTANTGSGSFSAGSGGDTNLRSTQQGNSAAADESPLPQQTRTTWQNTSSGEKATGRHAKQIGPRKSARSGGGKKEAQHKFWRFESVQSTLQLLLPTLALILKTYIIINRVYYEDVFKRMHGTNGLLRTLRVLYFKYSHHPAALAASLIQYILMLAVLQWKAAKHNRYTK